MSSGMNEKLILVMGESATGKSASLMNLKGKVAYLGTETGKELPFKHSFNAQRVTDPMQVPKSIDGIEKTDYDTAVIDSATFLMDMYESQYVLTAENTQEAWQHYQQFWKNLMQKTIAKSSKAIIITAHTDTTIDGNGRSNTSIPVKGALKRQGLEAYFTLAVATKRVSIDDLKSYRENNDLLRITEQDEELGFKYVFQTMLTKATIGEKIRSPIGMFTRAQTFMDNDCQLLLDHVSNFYN